MHNTSGIRDMLEIMHLGGLDLGQPCEPQDLLDGVCRQRGLNFVPGSRDLCSNSTFMLLGRIAEQVSEQPFRDFLDRRIFAPLGMNATRGVERTTEVVENLATWYFPGRHGGWTRAQHVFRCTARVAWFRLLPTSRYGTPTSPRRIWADPRSQTRLRR
jgi:D-aminopeptidase